MSGSNENDKFFVGAKDTVTAARFATFMLRQMGYQVPDYRQSVAMLAETKGSKIDATITGDLTRDYAVGMMYGALTAEKASGKTVIADIVGHNNDLKAKAEKLGLLGPTPDQSNNSKRSSGRGSNKLSVMNCNANNERIKITFSKDFDIEVATDPDSYLATKLSDNEEVPFSVVLDASTKSVELVFSAKLDDNTAYQLLIKKYKDLSGNMNASEYPYGFTTLDYTHPEVIDKPEIDHHCFAIAEKGKIFFYCLL